MELYGNISFKLHRNLFVCQCDLQKVLFVLVARKFAVDVIEPLVRQMDEKSQLDKSIIQGLFDNGLMGIEIPHELGGPGCSFFAVVIIVEELSRIDPSVGVFCDVQNTLVAPMIQRWGSD